MYIGSRIDEKEIVVVKTKNVIQMEIDSELLRDMCYVFDVPNGYNPPSGKNIEKVRRKMRDLLRETYRAYSNDR